jgi:Ca2+-binding RTX toxin-like protein
VYSIEIAPGDTFADVGLQAIIDGPAAEGAESVLLTVVGTDTAGVDVETAADVSLDADPATGYGSILDVPALMGGAGDDRITGTAGDDVIIGGKGNDRLTGGAGNDTFRVGLGDGFDRFDGGAGNDRIEATADGVAIGMTGSFGPANGIETIGANGYAGVTIQGDGGNNTLDFSQTTLAGIAAIDGGAGNDQITGSAGDDVIIGGKGNDTLTGGDGADIFSFDFGGARGGTGRDTIRDFKLGDGDVLRFTSVLDGNLNGPDPDDLSQAVSRVTDNGQHVVVTFVDGGSLTLQGLGTGAITSIDALLTALGPNGVEVA